MKKFTPYIGFGVFLILALIVMIAKPFSPDLNETGQMVIGGLLIAVGIWIFKPLGLPFSMGGAFLAAFLLIQGLAPAVVFAGFTQSALWTLIPALFFGFVLQKTGLGKRIALAIIKLFPPTYISLILAWAVIGIVLSVLTPSITVRVAIVVPIAMYCCELFALKKGSKGNSLILLTAFAMALIPGTGWLSGSLWGPIIQGLYEAVPGMEGLVTFETYLQIAFVPMILVTVILVVGGYLVLKPDEPLSREAAAELKKTKANPMTREEKTTGIILILVFVFFITNGIHGIPDAAVCLVALVCFFIFRVMEVKEVSTGINWDLIVFLGVALGLGAVFASTGVSEWIAGVIVPLLAPITGSPWIFMFVVLVIMFAWRFIDIAILIPTMAILTPVLPAVAQAYGFDPLVWILIYLMAGNAMFMAYQNMWALMSTSVAGDRAWTGGHLARYGTVYFVACLIAMAVAIPLYIGSGLL